MDLKFEWDEEKAKRNKIKHKVEFSEPMKKKTNDDKSDELRSEYPVEMIRDGTRGKYAKRFHSGNNLADLAGKGNIPKKKIAMKKLPRTDGSGNRLSERHRKT